MKTIPGSRFRPEMEGGGYRTFSIEDLSPEQIAALRAVAVSVRDAAMRARICDVCWTLDRKHFEIGRAAVRAYFESAMTIAGQTPSLACDDITRAVQMAALLGKGAEYEKLIGDLERVVDREDLPSTVVLHALRQLLEHRTGDAAKLRSAAEKWARRCDATKDWWHERDFLQLIEKLSRRLNDNDGVREAQLGTADSYLREADALASLNDPTASPAAAHRLEHGLHALRRVKGTEERQKQVHRRLLDSQFAQSEQMGRISATTDVSDAIRASREQVRGATSPEDALFKLALIVRSPRTDELRAEVLEAAAKAPLRFSIASVAVDAAGKPIGKQGRLLSDDPEEHEAALRSQMAMHGNFHRAASVSGGIVPAVDQIQLEHVITRADFDRLVSNSPFIPPGHAMSFSLGLHAGFHQRLIESTHILVGQIEAAIRHVLNSQKVITSKLSAEGIQEERNLNELLAMPETTEVFGEDIVFDLQSLLVERFGGNLRNNVAHGLLTDAGTAGRASSLLFRSAGQPSCSFRQFFGMPSSRLSAFLLL